MTLTKNRFKKSIFDKICLGTGELLKDNVQDRTEVFKKFFSDGGRLVDTARIYHDGKSLKIIKKLNLKFNLIAKPSYLKKDKNTSIKKKFKEYKKLCGINKIDFFITHWPNEKISKKKIKQFLSLKNDQKLENIGIGNARFEDIKIFHKFSNKNLNAIEIELNIFNFFFQKKILSFCKRNNIKVFGYSPVRWCKFKSFNNSSKIILNKISKKYGLNFKDISLLFSLYKGVIPIVSLKNISRYNKLKKLSNFLDNKVLKKQIFSLERKIRRVELVDPSKIYYTVNNSMVKLSEINLDLNEIKMIKNEIKSNKAIIKPVILKKKDDNFLVLDGKIRCKALYELNKKINCIIL